MQAPRLPARGRSSLSSLTIPLCLSLLAACSAKQPVASPTPSRSPARAASPSPSPIFPLPSGPTLTVGAASAAHFLLFLGGNLADLSVTRIEGKDADLSSQPLGLMQGAPHDPNNAIFAPALSPDRKRVAYVELLASQAADPNSSGQGSLVVQGIDGSAAKVIAASGPSGDNGSPAWSPDGSQIAFLRGDRLWLTAPDGANQHAVALSLPINTHLAWSADGKRLAVGTGTPSRLAVIDLTTLTYNFVGPTGAQVDHPAFSPDGKELAYGVAGANALFVANADGTGSARQLTTCLHPDCIRDLEPAWSPDGAFIAFVRFAPSPQSPGAQQVYIVPAAGGEIRAITSGLEQHAFPTW